MTRNLHARLDKLSKRIGFCEVPILNESTLAFLDLISTPELDELMKFVRVEGIMSIEEILSCGALHPETIKILKELIPEQAKEQHSSEVAI